MKQFRLLSLMLGAAALHGAEGADVPSASAQTSEDAGGSAIDVQTKTRGKTLDLTLPTPPPTTDAFGRQTLAPGLTNLVAQPQSAFSPATAADRMVATTRQNDWLAAGLRELEFDRMARARPSLSPRESARESLRVPLGVAGLPRLESDGRVAPIARVALPQPSPRPNPYLSDTKVTGASTSAPPSPAQTRPLLVPTPAAPTPTPVSPQTPALTPEEEERYFKQLKRI